VYAYTVEAHPAGLNQPHAVARLIARQAIARELSFETAPAISPNEYPLTPPYYSFPTPVTPFP